METILIAVETPPKSSPELLSNNKFTFPIALCAAILFVSVWLMLRGRLIKNRSCSASTPITPTNPNLVESTQLDHALETYETVRELTGKLDTKIRILDAFIRDADRAAARLEAAQRGEAPPAQPARSAESCVDEIYLYADYGFPPADIASRLSVPIESVERILANRH